MADQVADLYEAGIPYDIVLARSEVQGFSDEASASADAAELSATHAGQSATLAAIYAEEAREYAELRVESVTVSEDPPGEENRWGGKVWIEVDGTDILTLNVWDETAAGHALSPDVDLSPSDSLSPADAGVWVTYNFPTA